MNDFFNPALGFSVFAVTFFASLAVPSSVRAEPLPLYGGKKAAFNDRALPRKDRAKFGFRSDAGLASIANPECPASSRIRIVTSATAYSPVVLDCARWETKGEAYRYDGIKPYADADGVRKIRYRPGRLDITFKGANYASNAVGGPVSWIETSFTANGVEYCGRWEDLHKNEIDRVLAKGPTVACQVTGPCANGVVDGDESGVDCGGSCSPCPLGGSCNQDADCNLAAGQYCDAGSCLGSGYAGVCSTADAPTPGGTGWMDSYAVDGRCWCDSGFDHGIGAVSVDTPVGPRTVQDICMQLDAFAPPRQTGDPIFNDVQCGNGPANGAGDEDPDQCPGRVDQGTGGCCTIGPTWDLGLIE